MRYVCCVTILGFRTFPDTAADRRRLPPARPAAAAAAIAAAVMLVTGLGGCGRGGELPDGARVVTA
ncbi:MAG: hypothetical protein ACRDT2_22915, partial [Natronosporangium sp.]